MLLATLLMNPKQIALGDLDRMVRSLTFTQLADWLDAYVIKAHPQKELLREKWMKAGHPMALRAGWSLTAHRVAKDPAGLDLVGLLDRIEREMGGAPFVVQWTMNFCLAYIGIHFPEHRQRAIAIGEKLGVFRDYPTSKGCTSPFAPIWINEMVRRQG
jgi:3-methyladenine DNA glycosylase AlkD